MKQYSFAVLGIVAVVSLSFVSVGYAVEHISSTLNSNDTLDVRYMLLEMNDNAVTEECLFVFPDVEYYTDRVIGGTTDYTHITKDSDKVKVRLNSTEQGTSFLASMKVRLAEQHSEATFSLRFYTDEGCTDPHGNPIALTSTDQVVSVQFNINTDYYCILTVTMVPSYLASHPSGELVFGTVFTATVSTD